MATTNVKGGQVSDVRVQATQSAKVIAAAAKTIKKPAATPAVVVKLNQAVAQTSPTYNAAGKTTAAAASPKPAAAPKTAPQPAAAKAPQPAAAKSPQPAAAAKSPAPAVAAKVPAQSSAARAPAADGSLYTSGSGSVTVDIQASDSGYENKIYWSADNWKTRNYLGVDHHTASFDLGSFSKGTKIEFGIDNGQGDFFKTGGGNTDGFQHTRVSSDASSMTVGFEDLRGGGDQDFNDAIIRVGGLSNAQPGSPVSPAPVAEQKPAAVVKPAPAPQKPETKDNRSGLGDGTNPGKGDGRVNSPNQGTENPNQSRTAAVKKPAAAVSKIIKNV